MKSFFFRMVAGCLLIGVFLPQQLFAQHPQPYVITGIDLCRNCGKIPAYDLETDSNDHVYIAGPAGIFRYTGSTEPIRYGMANALSKQSYVDLEKDSYGRIWAKGTSGQFTLIGKDTLTSYPYNDNLPLIKAYHHESIHFDSEGGLHIGSRAHGYFYMSPEGKLDTLMGRDAPIYGFVVTHLEDGTPISFSIHNTAFPPEKRIRHLYYWDRKSPPRDLGILKDQTISYRSKLVEHQDGSLSLAPGSKEIVRFNRDSIIDQQLMDSYLLGLFEDSNQNLWAGTIEKGVYLIPKGDFSRQVQLLDGENAAACAADQFGGVWIKTNKTGAAYYPPSPSQRFADSTGQIAFADLSPITSDGQRIYGIGKESLVIIEGDSVSYLDFPLIPAVKGHSNAKRRPLKILYDSINNLLWLAYYGHIASWDGTQWSMWHIKEAPHYRISDMMVAPDGTLVGLIQEFIFEFKNGAYDIVSAIDQGPVGLKYLNVIDNGNYWVSSWNGLWKWDGKQFQKPDFLPDFLKEQRMAQLYSAQGITYLVNADSGLVALKDEKVIVVKTENGDRIFCHRGANAPDGVFWCRSSNTRTVLSRIDYQDGQFNISDYYFDDLADRSSGAGGVGFTKEHLYFASTNGLFSRKINELRPSGPRLRMFIREVHINRQKMPLASGYELEHDQNSLIVKFEEVGYRSRKRAFRYRLVGFDTAWTNTGFSTIQYTNLDPGDYVLEVQASYVEEPWSDSATIQLNIATPFWQTWWFYTLIAVALLGVIGGAVWWWTRLQQRRSDLLINTLKAEQKAMIAQMNPHFMFNALSSIQDLVFSQQRNQAVINIALFARLMRKILDHSSRETVTLSEELEALELYLQLESLRFKGRFDYSIQVGASIEPEKHLLPPVLLQPFAENSIKHGLLNKKPAGGTLSLHIAKQENGLLVTLADDGIGRERSAALKAQRASSHRSYGMKLAEERIALFNTTHDQPMHIQVTDLYDQQGIGNGTKVELTIPKL